jgi:hypothetical protein
VRAKILSHLSVDSPGNQKKLRGHRDFEGEHWAEFREFLIWVYIVPYSIINRFRNIERDSSLEKTIFNDFLTLMASDPWKYISSLNNAEEAILWTFHGYPSWQVVSINYVPSERVVKNCFGFQCELVNLVAQLLWEIEQAEAGETSCQISDSANKDREPTVQNERPWLDFSALCCICIINGNVVKLREESQWERGVSGAR